MQVKKEGHVQLDMTFCVDVLMDSRRGYRESRRIARLRTRLKREFR